MIINHKILVIDDEEDIRDLLLYNLTQAGYQTAVEKNGKKGIEKCLKFLPDLVLLDIMMPEKDGIEICREIRENKDFKDTIIIFLTARGEEYSEIAAFDAGADDFITKPIRTRALLSRIQAAFRRKNEKNIVSQTHNTPLVIGNLILDINNYSIKKDGKEVIFTKKEYKLFFFLATHPNQLFTREDLLKNIWENGVHVTNRTIDVHIRKIREKLDTNYIITKKGVGYMFKISTEN